MLSIVVGMMIAIGSTVYLTLSELEGALLFSMELLTILCLKLELFTGKAGLLATREITLGFWTSKIDAVSIESLSKEYVLIHKDIPIVPAVFFIVGNVAGDIIDSIINSACPMIDDRVIYDVTVGVYSIENESVLQDLGKPVAASVTKAFNDFLSFTIIRESRYELHHCLM